MNSVPMTKLSAAIALASTFVLLFVSSLAAVPQRSRSRSAPKTSVPTTAFVRAQLEAKGKKEQLFTVKGFRRLNGFDRGSDGYTVEFEAVVKCLKSGGMLQLAGDPPCNGEGETVRYSSNVWLQKTENGWRVLLWGS